jgi:hypothetical protein
MDGDIFNWSGSFLLIGSYHYIERSPRRDICHDPRCQTTTSKGIQGPSRQSGNWKPKKKIDFLGDHTSDWTLWTFLWLSPDGTDDGGFFVFVF